MSWPTTDELDDLVSRFRDRTLPKVEWTHRAHLAVGTWHVHRYGPARAIELLRGGITRLNEAHGTVNDDGGGYHETVTRAYVQLLSAFVASQAGRPAAECAQAILASPLAAKKALLAYYSAKKLMSVAARRGWVEPDVAPLGPSETGARPSGPA